MAVNALQYIKNVGRSFGYSAIDTFKYYNPQVTALASGAKEFSSDLYSSIEDFKASIKGNDDGDAKGLFGKGKDYVSEFRNNLFEDLKSGNWYNKERIERNENDVMSAMFGFDEDNFNLDDWDLDSDDPFAEEDNDVDAGIANDNKNAAAIIDSMDMVGSKSANAISNATVRSADYIVSSGRQNSKALYSLNQRGFMQVSSGLAAINSNIAALVTLGEPLTTHMQNSATFYTQSAEFQKSVLEKLDSINKALQPAEKKNSNKDKITLSDVLDSSGVVDMSAYFDMIRQNVKKAKDEAVDMGDMFGGVDNIVKLFTESPMQFVTDATMKGIVPNIMQESMKSFNESLEAFFPAMIDKLQNTRFGGVLGDLLDFAKGTIFPENDFKKKVDTKNYNHGKVDWNGESEIALKEVIPTYLAAITSAITGGPMTQYDYKNGKFVMTAGIRNLENEREQKHARYAGGDFREDALSTIKGLGLDKKSEDKLTKEVENYFLNSFRKGATEATKIMQSDFNYKSFGLDVESLDILREILSQYQKRGSTKTANKFAGQIRLEQDSYGAGTRNIENEGGVERYLYNNANVLSGDDKFKKAPGGLLGVDEDGKDIWFYLRELYKSNWYLADNIDLFGSGLSGGGPNIGGGGGKLRTPTPVKSIIGSTQESTEAASEKYSGNDTFDDLGEKGEKIVKDLIDDILGQRISSREGRPGGKTIAEEEKKKREKEEERARAEAYGFEYEDDKDSKFDKFRDRFSNADELKFFDKIRSRVNNIFSAPGKVFANILSSGEQSMYNLIYGKEGSEDEGLFGYFFKKADKLFDSFDEFFKDKFKFSIKEWLKGMTETEFAQETTDELKKAGRWVNNKFKDIFGFGNTNKEGEGKTEQADSLANLVLSNARYQGGAATGRKVTKTGVVAVSEGELIIPSKYNPFYHGTNDTRKQLKNEKKQANRFFGFYPTGGTIKGGTADGLTEEEYTNFWENYVDFDENDTATGAHGSRFNRDRNVKRSQKKGATVKDLFFGSFSKLLNGMEDVAKAMSPKKGEEKVIDKILSDENKKRLKDAGIPEETIKNRGAIGAGALIGAGTSILTGCLVGPLAGAAIGGAVGLVVKSEKVQKALFGDIDEDGNRANGILPEDIANFIQKKVPNAGIAAALGTGVGLFMGSPILGAFVGGAIGFAAQSDKVKNTIFGEFDEDGERSGGFISKELQKKIKEAAPNIGAGALAGLIAGPFGIVGNIVVGSAIGYATTTEGFKDKILGKPDENGNRTGGIVGEFRGYLFGFENEKGEHKQGVFESIVGIFNKLGNEIKFHSKNIFTNLSKTLRRAVQRAYQTTFKQWLDNLGNSLPGRAVRKIGQGAVGLAKTPFRLLRGGLEGMDKALGRRALTQGINMNNEEGQAMTSTERKAQARAYGMAEYESTDAGKLDTLMENMTPEQLDQFSEYLQFMEDPTKKYDKDEFNQKRDLANQLDAYGVDGTLAVKLEKAANGEFSIGSRLKGETFDSILEGSNLSKEQKKVIRDQYIGIQDTKKARKDVQADASKFRKQLAGDNDYGIDINESNAAIYRKLVENDKDRRFAPKTEEEKAKEKQDEAQDATIEMKDTVKTIHDILLDISMNGIGNGKKPEGEENKEDTTEDKQKTAKEVVNEVESKPNNKVEVDNGLDNKNDVTTQIDPLTGQPIQYVKNNQGEAIVDASDSETKKTMDVKSRMTNAILSIPLIGTGLKGLGSVFGGLKDTLFGSKEKEGSGLFSKLFNTFFGEDSFLGGIFGTLKSFLFGDTSPLRIGKSGVGAFIKSAIPSIIAGGALVGLLSGGFDKLAKDITGGAYGDGTGKTVGTDSEGNPHQLQTDEKGNPLTDEDGDYLDTNGNKVDKDSVTLQYDVGARDSLSTKAYKNIGTSLLNGGSSVASTLVSVATKGKVDASGKAITGALSDVATNGANSKLIQSILKGLSEFLEKIPTFIQSCPIIPSSIKEKVAEKGDDFVIYIYDKLADKISGLAESKLGAIASGISSVLGYVNVAATVLILVNGWTGAEGILKVEEASTSQRFIAALVALINSKLPVIANFIPNDLLVDIFLKACDIIGIDMSSLEQQRAELTEKVAQYNAENGTNFTEYEYLDYQGKTGLVNNVVKGGKNLIRNAGTMAKGAVSKVGSVVSGAASKVGEFASGVGSTISGAASHVAEGASNIMTQIKSIANVVPEEVKNMNKLTKDKNSTVSDILDIPKDEGSFAGITHMLRLGTRVLYIPASLIATIGRKIGSFVGGIVDTIKQAVVNNVQQNANIAELAKSGDIDGTLNYEYQEVEGNPLSGIQKATFFLNKIIYVPMALVCNIGNKIGEFIGNVTDTIMTAATNCQSNIENIKTAANEGDLDAVWDTKYQEVEDNPIDGIYKATFFINKLVYTPVALFKSVSTSVGNFISKKTDAIGGDYNTLQSNTEKMAKYAEDGKISEIWSLKFEASEENPIGLIFGGISNINKIFYTLGAIGHNLFGAVGNFLGNAASTVKDKAASAVNTVKNTASNALNSAWSAFKGFVGSGSGVGEYRGRGSVSKKNDTFVSQYDPDYADMKLGNSTVSDLGCAPATATMMANFIKPGSMKMTDAVSKAANYESDEGTSADYFKSVLGSKGLKTDYIETNNRSSRDNLIKSIASGKPAVLLGEDTSNGSKTASPFGPSAHYVMAKGFDKNGNVIIDDPESDTPNKAYSSNILNNVKLGVLSDQDVFEENTDDSVDYVKKTGALNFTGGAGVPDNDISRNVYGFFTSRGYSPAAAAGILGNANQESGVNPAMIQGNGKGPAAGLFQWENYNTKDSRWLAMNNYAASKGKDWTDLDSQLEYALTEIESSDINNRMSKNHNVSDIDGKTYNIPAINGVEAFKKLTDPVQAMQVFEASFERAGKPGFANREKYATEYYNLYSGSTYTGNYDSSVGSATGGTSYSDSSTGTSNSSSSSSGGILGAISSAFTSVLGGILGLGSSDSSSSSSSSSGTDSGTYTTTDGSLGAASTPDGQGTAQSFIDVAKSQLGVVEGVDNITPYGKFTGTDGAAWCAAFVSWVMNKAFNGDDAAAKKALRGGYSAAVSTLWNQFKNANAMSSTPEPGDIVIYKNAGASHTGLVETVNGNNITTIEGNTSGDNAYERNGGMVARKSFDITSRAQLTGFGRPDWDGAAQIAIANGSIKSSTGSTLKEGSSSAGDLVRDFYGSGSKLNSAGNNMRLGHGGDDPGPKLTEITKVANRYIGAKRFNSLVDQTADFSYSSSAAKKNADSKFVGSGSMLDKLEGREGSDGKEKVAKLKQTKVINGKKLKYYSGGASSLESDTNVATSPSDSTSIIALLKTIVSTLKTVATNTTDISTISTTLTNYANSANTSKVSAASNTTTSTNNTSNTSTSKVDPSNDPALKDLMNTLGAIAEG